MPYSGSADEPAGAAGAAGGPADRAADKAVEGAADAAAGSLAGRVVVVLGGTGGIGLALARGLRAAGATVVPSGRRREPIEDALAALGQPEIPPLTCDTTDEGDLVGLRDATVERLGRVDGLVHAAGIHLRRAARETSASDWRQVLETNLTGAFLACRAFAEPMLEQRYGRMVTVSSVGARVGLRDASAYCASKGGVEQLTKVLAVEWAEYGVTVNALVPGFFITELNAAILAPGTQRRAAVDARVPAGRTGSVDELAGAVVYLCSGAARYTTGSTIEVDGGFLAQGI